MIIALRLLRDTLDGDIWISRLVCHRPRLYSDIIEDCSLHNIVVANNIPEHIAVTLEQ